MNLMIRIAPKAYASALRGTFLLIAVAPFALHGLALAIVGLLLASSSGGARWLLFGLAPVLYTLSVAGFAAVLARTVVNRVATGRFSRSETDSDYVARRLYGTCWATLYYCKPVYFLLLGVPCLRRSLFEAFGYRGRSMDFTIYPDSWIRDLPLLDFDEGVYISNRATIGTNVVRPGGMIHVDRVAIGARSIVGHLAMIAPGARLGADVELGVGSAVGFKTVLADGVRIGGNCTVDHATRLGERVQVGHSVHIGLRCSIGPGLRLPAGTVVPDHTSLRTQEDVERLLTVGRGFQR